MNSYLVTPNGSLQKYNYKTGKINVISNNMPSDEKDPDRLNKRQSNVEHDVLTDNEYIQINKKILYEEY